jgi:sec-independent protein translocase protein TatA
MGPEWIVVAVVAVAVLFGAKKLPEMARSVGRAQGEFKKGLKEGVLPDADEPAAEAKPAETKPDAES